MCSPRLVFFPTHWFPKCHFWALNYAEESFAALALRKKCVYVTSSASSSLIHLSIFSGKSVWRKIFKFQKKVETKLLWKNCQNHMVLCVQDRSKSQVKTESDMYALAIFQCVHFPSLFKSIGKDWITSHIT